MSTERLIVLCGALAACNVAAPPTPDLAITLSEPLLVTPTVYRVGEAAQSELFDGDAVDLELPPQGGYVIFVGARVRNCGEAAVALHGRLLELATDGGEVVRGEDMRTIQMVRSATDGTVWTPPLQSYVGVANIPVCPDRTAQDLFGRALMLELTVTELGSGRVGVGRRVVTPVCRQADPTLKAKCECVCARNFVVGRCP